MKNVFDYFDPLDFNPLTVFEVALGPTVRFKGGGSTPPPPSSGIRDTPERQATRDELFPMLRNALGGRGFGPTSLTNLRDSDRRAGLEKSFATTRSDVQSQLRRTVDPRDTRVTSFVSQGLDRAFNTSRDNLNRQIRSERTADEQFGRGLTADVLANEQRISISGQQAFNQAAQLNFSREQDFGTFGTNVAGGLGSGLTDAYFARIMAGNTTV